MGEIQSVIENVRPDMSPELSWAIITLFSIIIVWVTIRYINRLDTMIDRIDTAIEQIKDNMLLLSETQKNHKAELDEAKKDIRELKNRPKR